MISPSSKSNCSPFSSSFTLQHRFCRYPAFLHSLLELRKNYKVCIFSSFALALISFGQHDTCLFWPTPIFQNWNVLNIFPAFSGVDELLGPLPTSTMHTEARWPFSELPQNVAINSSLPSLEQLAPAPRPFNSPRFDTYLIPLPAHFLATLASTFRSHDPAATIATAIVIPPITRRPHFTSMNRNTTLILSRNLS